VSVDDSPIGYNKKPRKANKQNAAAQASLKMLAIVKVVEMPYAVVYNNCGPVCSHISSSVSI
jgi:hypothetical protein